MIDVIKDVDPRFDVDSGESSGKLSGVIADERKTNEKGMVLLEWAVIIAVLLLIAYMFINNKK